MNPPLATDLQMRPDGELLQRYVESRDDQALTELVMRHAALVRGVCQRVLGTTPDADDAFQATFLVLIRCGERIRRPASLAAWLYGVAHRISRRQRRHQARQFMQLREEQTMVFPDPFTELATQHDVALFDAELARLPEKYRAPIVLHHLEGKSQREVAAELQLTEGAVDGLLKRGRNELRLRLAKRGVVFGVTLAVLEQAQKAMAATPSESLITAIVKGALSLDPVMSPEFPKTPAAQMARQEWTMLSILQTSKVMAWTAIGALMFGAAGFGVSNGRLGASFAAVGPIGSELAVGPLEWNTDAAIVAVDASEPKAILHPAPQDNSATPDGLSDQEDEVNGTFASLDENDLDDDAAADPFSKRPKTAVRTAAKTTDKADEGDKRTDEEQETETVIHYRRLTEKESRLYDALQAETEVAFVETSLRDALDYIEQLHGIDVVINEKEIADEGASPEVRLSLELKGVSLHSALSLMLEPHDLDYVVKNEVLMITAAAKAEEFRELRVYDLKQLSTLIPKLDFDDVDDVKRVESVIKNAVQGDWAPEDEDGGTISLTSAGLVVRQNQRTHREIENLLEQLRRANGAK
jgi:RNA polymerase sigma factor (sigma-70 family)